MHPLILRNARPSRPSESEAVANGVKITSVSKDEADSRASWFEMAHSRRLTMRV
jgi:hypothetical protein